MVTSCLILPLKLTNFVTSLCGILNASLGVSLNAKHIFTIQISDPTSRSCNPSAEELVNNRALCILHKIAHGLSAQICWKHGTTQLWRGAKVGACHKLEACAKWETSDSKGWWLRFYTTKKQITNSIKTDGWLIVRVGEKMTTKNKGRRGLGTAVHTFKPKAGGRNRLMSMTWRLAWSM